MMYPIKIEKVELEGIRGYLQKEPFELKCNNLVIYATNGRGKSSLVDAFEYYFSPEGTLRRLGQRLSTNKAGPEYIKNVHADKRRIQTSVHIWFKQGRTLFDAARLFPEDMPGIAQNVFNQYKVPFIIRGHELRQFVENVSSKERYVELVKWFELEPLATIQDNLKKLSPRITQIISHNKRKHDGYLRELMNITKDLVQEFDECTVLNWFNTSMLKQWNKPFRCKILAEDDAAFQELQKQKNADMATRYNELNRLLRSIGNIVGSSVPTHDDSREDIDFFEQSVVRFNEAAHKEESMRSAISKAIFDDIWSRANELFKNNPHLVQCPVCGTKFADSPHGSLIKICSSIDRNLEELKEYHNAKSTKDDALVILNRAADNLRNALKVFLELIDIAYNYDAIAAYYKTLKSWNIEQPIPDSKNAMNELTTILESINSNIRQIELKKDEFPYDFAIDIFRKLIKIKLDLKNIYEYNMSLQSIQRNLDGQITLFGSEIVKHVNGVIDELQDEINCIYKSIQGTRDPAPPVRLEFPKEGAKEKRSIQLLIDFKNTYKNIMPNAVLSDSQVQTLALSIRLAAIRKLNTNVNVLVLDDIVNSYDQDHRKYIASTLSKHFGDFQIIVTTHDKLFYRYLRDDLDKNTKFREINDFQEDHGPIFDDYTPPEEEIEKELYKRNVPSYKIRTFIEKWFKDICNDFDVKISYKCREEHKLTIGPLSSALLEFMNNHKLGKTNTWQELKPVLEKLQHGQIINLGNHDQSDLDMDPSYGDWQAEWNEFKRFRSMFVCDCGHRRFERDGTELNCKKCDLSFNFKPERIVNPREYAVYFNKWNTHICIHGPGCSQIKKRGGTHAYEQSGKWVFFAEEDKAREYAKTVSESEHIGLVRDCWFCKKQDRL